MELDPRLILAIFASFIAIVIFAQKNDASAVTSKELSLQAIHSVQAQHFQSLSVTMVEKIALIESAYQLNAKRTEPDGRVSIGIMQTLIGTAQEMWQRGYRAYDKPTERSLTDPYVSAYFGMAYLDWLQKSYGVTGENLVRGYNGGPGGFLTAHGRNLTEPYLAKYRRV